MDRVDLWGVSRKTLEVPMRRLILFLLLIHCKHNSGTNNGVSDLSLPTDLLSTPADLATAVDLAAVTDLATFDLTATGCNRDASVCGECTPTGGSNVRMFVVNTFTVPTNGSTYAHDLTGDGMPVDLYGHLVAADVSESIDDQTPMQTSVTTGANILLIKLTSSDAAFANDTCAAVDVYVGQTMNSPNFSGSGSFTIDSTIPVGHFLGPIVNSVFSAAEPAQRTDAIPLSIMLTVAGTPVRVPLIGSYITFTNGGTTVMNGIISGAVRNSEVESTFCVGIAAGYNGEINSSPTSQESMDLLSLFDTGGTPDTTGTCSGVCKNPNAGVHPNQCAVVGDHFIDTCEVATNAIIESLLRPDVQMYDNSGTTYQPSAANAHPDSLSVGIGFTAVGATF